MKKVLSINLLVLLMVACAGILPAQNPFHSNGPQNTPVVSEVQVYDLENGTGLVEIRISGQGSESITSLGVVVSGDRVPGGSAITTAGGTRPCDLCGGSVSTIVTAIFPLGPEIGNGQAGMVTVDISSTAAIILPGSGIRKRPKKYY